MKQTLDRALADILPLVTGLRAVILSAAPDGLIAWCWSRDDKPEIALGFAALDRAATDCLSGLGASQHARSLLLTAKDAWVASWPLHEPEAHDDARPRLVITAVFDGELQGGIVMVYGTRVRRHIRAAIDAAMDPRVEELRSLLVEAMLRAKDPGAALGEVAEASKLEPRALMHLEELNSDERQRVFASVRPITPLPHLSA